MQRITFRRVLPIAQLILAAALWQLGNAQSKAFHTAWNAQRSVHGPTKANQDPNEGVVAWNLVDMWDGWYPPAHEVLLAVNLPATLSVLPVIVLDPYAPDKIYWPPFFVGIFGLWYGIVVFLDRSFSKRSSQKLVTRGRGFLRNWVGFVSLTIVVLASGTCLAHADMRSGWEVCLWLFLWSILGVIYFLARIILSRQIA